MNVLLKLKNIGLSEGLIKDVRFRLIHIAKHCDLDNPEKVIEFIAEKDCENSNKDNLVKACTYYVEVNELSWIKLRYKWTSKIPNVPSTEFIKQLVAFATPRYAPIFKSVSETGAMPIELHYTQRWDIILEREAIDITGRKSHASRVISLKPKMVVMLKTYLSKNLRKYPFPKPCLVSKVYRR